MKKSHESRSTPRVARVYDIKLCGPRNRFVANGCLVHNSGGDKMNWQNMSRGSTLREAVEAENGKVVCVGDSSNIESRVLDWLAGQNDAVDVYRKADAKLGPDVYCVLAEKIYQRPVNKKDHPDERQMGKIAKLGLGYGMGGPKFMQAVRVQTKGKVRPDEQTARNIVAVYRGAHPMVLDLWKRAETALGFILKGVGGKPVDFRGIIVTDPLGFRLPNGLLIKYPDLQYKEGEGYSYWNGRSREKIYGGKCVENCIQALARIVVVDQTVEINKYLPVALSVHDEAVASTDEDDGKDAVEFMLECMRNPPEWGPDLPLNSEGGFHRSYGKAKS